MSLKTLSLNVAGVPVSVIDAKPKAILAIQNGRAIALANYENTIIRSSYCETFDLSLHKRNNSLISMPIPSVIQFIHSDYVPKRYTNVLPFSRRNVYIRDRGTCMYCGKKVALHSFTFDHIIPRCEGGTSCWENVVISCVKCNNQKDRMSLRKFKKKLIRQPYVPRLDKAAPLHLVSRVAGEIPHETWSDYIYWNVILKQ